MELISGRDTVELKETYSVFVDITFSGGVLSNLLAGADQATHFSPSGERAFETGKPIRIRRTANIVCDADRLQSPSDEI